MTAGAGPGSAEGSADVIIVAAGASRRMAGLDKLLAPVGGRPLVAWTIARVTAAPVVGRVIVVTAPERVREWTESSWMPDVVDAVVAGGSSRQVSVANGIRHLAMLDPDGGGRPVLVHDGARPLVSPALVAAVASAVLTHGAAIPVVPVAETLKRVGEGLVLGTVDRSDVAAAQTPQGARRHLFLEAYARFPPGEAPTFTDEAALLEACRIAVHAIPGHPMNLKVTLPDDLERVGRSLAPDGARVGFGHDSHPFGPGASLRLGGIAIDGAPALAGHSDGDVALHAVADALLGAAGLGDLGRLFPADARTPRGIASDGLLREVVERLGAAGLQPATVDLTIIGARPRLGARLEEMQRVVASLLRLDAGDVNVKASSGNLQGDEGAGRTISAHAVATVRHAS